VFEIERVGGDGRWEKLAVDALAKDQRSPPGAVVSKSVSDAAYRRGSSHIEIIREALKSCKKTVKMEAGLEPDIWGGRGEMRGFFAFGSE